MPCTVACTRALGFRTSLLLLAMAVACTREGAQTLDPTEPQIALSVATERGTVVLRRVPEIAIDLPPTSAPEEPETVFLDRVGAADGLAFVALKAPLAQRARDRAALGTDSISVEPRQVRRGTRSAIPAAQVKAALDSLAGYGATIVQYYDALGVALVRISAAAARGLRSHPNVEYLDPLRPGPALDIETAPSMARPVLATGSLTGQLVPWNIDSVRAPEAWAYSTGQGARLLIIDSGHDYTHPDLGPLPQENCNFGVYGGCNDDYPMWHGTPVAGVAIARDNIFGVVGVSHGISTGDRYYWGACSSGVCYYPEIYNALNWSAGNLGANAVINMSYSNSVYDQTEAIAVATAVAAGHVLVASAGNTGTQQIRYPAGYSNVIGVASITQTNTFHPGSTYGAHVDVVAPNDAYTTIPAQQYATVSGTSIAAPHVAGVAALIRAKYPSWSLSSVYYRLSRTAQALGPFVPFGWGKVRAHLAVAFEGPSITATTTASNRPKLSWSPVPFATDYRIYRRVTPLAPEWELWAEVSTTSYIDFSTIVTSFFGYNSYPSGVAVSYYVEAFSEGAQTNYTVYATYVPNGTPPF